MKHSTATSECVSCQHFPENDAWRPPPPSSPPITTTLRPRPAAPRRRNIKVSSVSADWLRAAQEQEVIWMQIEKQTVVDPTGSAGWRPYLSWRWSMVFEFPGCGCVTNMRVVTVVVLLLGLMFSQDAGSSRSDPLGPGLSRRTDPLGPGLSGRTPETGGKLPRWSSDWKMSSRIYIKNI